VNNLKKLIEAQATVARAQRDILLGLGGEFAGYEDEAVISEYVEALKASHEAAGNLAFLAEEIGFHEEAVEAEREVEAEAEDADDWGMYCGDPECDYCGDGVNEDEPVEAGINVAAVERAVTAN
jgi:hypothetical protein